MRNQYKERSHWLTYLTSHQHVKEVVIWEWCRVTCCHRKSLKYDLLVVEAGQLREGGSLLIHSAALHPSNALHQFLQHSAIVCKKRGRTLELDACACFVTN